MFQLRIVVITSNLLLSRCALFGEDDSCLYEDSDLQRLPVAIWK